MHFTASAGVATGTRVMTTASSGYSSPGIEESVLAPCGEVTSVVDAVGTIVETVVGATVDTDTDEGCMEEP